MQPAPTSSANSKSYQTFKFVAQMKTPAIIQGNLTLESLLAACVYEETGKMADEALALVPIAYLDTPEGRIYEATSVMFDGRVKLQKHQVVRGRHFTEVGPEFYAGNPRSRKDPWAVNQVSGAHLRLLNAYEMHEVSRLVWFARGDMEACKALLTTQKWIGKRRGSGFGEVSQIDAAPWTGNPLVDDDGSVRRPISLKQLPFVAGAAPAEQQHVVSTVCKNPAWLHEPELCATPYSRKLIDQTAYIMSGTSEIFFFD
jgi:CRISPR type IV-associated protein Csf3